MKIYSCNEKKAKWYKKVDWVRVLVLFVILFSICFCFFHFFIGGTGMLWKALISSFEISFLISLGFAVSYCIKNRINLYVVKDDNIYIIYPHSYGMEYDDGYVSYKDFRKLVKSEEKVVDIIKNVNKYTGIDVIKVDKVLSVKKYGKNFMFVANVYANEWYGKGGIISISEYVLKKKNCKMKFIIPSDYTKSNELYNLINDAKK